MIFADRFKSYIEKATDFEILDILNSGFCFEKELGGEKIAFWRSKDTISDPESRTVTTEFFCFPQNGEKNRMKQGINVTFDCTVENTVDEVTIFLNPGKIFFWPGEKYNMYYAKVASKAGRELMDKGINTFLHNKVVLVTPEDETVLLDEFDFSKYEFFMLGLMGGEFKVGLTLYQSSEN